ncbi:hypothetical protein JB92DRAFT_2968778, partial [Gautieria morchelliformis]
AARIVDSSTFASFAFLLYDHVLTFDAEVELVWKYPGWILGKVLFFFNRYLGPFTIILNILGAIAVVKTVRFLTHSTSVHKSFCFFEGALVSTYYSSRPLMSSQ